jgi:hypothetical protein
MRNFGRMTLLVGLTVAGNAASVHAQSRQYFTRVTTTAEIDVRSSSARDLRSDRAREVRSASASTRLASTASARGTYVSSSRSQSEVLHPYTARAQAQSQDRESDGAGRFSTWREEPQQADPAPRASSPPRSHNYYPTLGTAVYATQPVRLTARATFFPGGCCSASRSQAMAGAGHHR